MTGHDVPGGASRIAGRPAGRPALTARIKGGERDSPTSSRPSISVIPRYFDEEITPRRRAVSRIAFLGQTRTHPPHPWHMEGKTRGIVPKETIA